MLRTFFIQAIMLAAVFCLTSALVLARDAITGGPRMLVSTGYDVPVASDY